MEFFRNILSCLNAISLCLIDSFVSRFRQNQWIAFNDCYLYFSLYNEAYMSCRLFYIFIHVITNLNGSCYYFEELQSFLTYHLYCKSSYNRTTRFLSLCEIIQISLINIKQSRNDLINVITKYFIFDRPLTYRKYRKGFLRPPKCLMKSVYNPGGNSGYVVNWFMECPRDATECVLFICLERLTRHYFCLQQPTVLWICCLYA